MLNSSLIFFLSPITVIPSSVKSFSLSFETISKLTSLFFSKTVIYSESPLSRNNLCTGEILDFQRKDDARDFFQPAGPKVNS